MVIVKNENKRCLIYNFSEFNTGIFRLLLYLEMSGGKVKDADTDKCDQTKSTKRWNKWVTITVYLTG